MSILEERQNTVKSRDHGTGHTPAGAVLTDLIIPVIRLESHFSRAGEAIAASAGQTLARWLTLEMVADQPATVAQVARKLGLTRQSVQRIADLLDQDGLAEYVPNPAHQRAKLLRLTRRGQETLRQIRTAQRAWANRVGAEIGEANLRHAQEVVEQLTALLATHPYPDAPPQPSSASRTTHRR